MGWRAVLDGFVITVAFCGLVYVVSLAVGVENSVRPYTPAEGE